MVKEGLVEEHSSYIQGGKQHQKVYFLTNKGRAAAIWMHDNSKNQPGDKDNDGGFKSDLRTNWKTNAPTIKKTRRRSGRTERASIVR
jgi:hypothetical protein